MTSDEKLRSGKQLVEPSGAQVFFWLWHMAIISYRDKKANSGSQSSEWVEQEMFPDR